MTGGKSPRARGDYFERQTKADLEAHGLLVVRFPGSGSGDTLVSDAHVDLIAIGRNKRPLLISCKLGGRISPAERTALSVAADRFGATCVVASRPARGTILYRPLRPDDDPTTIGPT